MSETPQEIAVLVQDILIVRYAAVVALVLLIYDYCLTFDDEKRLIWPSRFSFSKLIFFVNRYMPIVAIGSIVPLLIGVPFDNIDVCKPIFLVFCGMMEGTYITAEVILYMRAYAVWGCKRSILVFILIVQTIWYSTGLFFTITFFASVTVIDIPLLPSGCIVSFNDRIDWAAFISIICSELTALILLVVKAYSMRRSALMQTMFRDGIAYFMFILLASIANLIILKVTSATLCNFLLLTQGALHSIFCNRLLLHIRGAYEHSDVLASGYAQETTAASFKMTPLKGMTRLVTQDTSIA